MQKSSQIDYHIDSIAQGFLSLLPVLASEQLYPKKTHL